MSKTVAKVKCGNPTCGKTPEMFWLAVDGKVFCNTGCYGEYHASLEKGTKRFEAEQE